MSKPLLNLELPEPVQKEARRPSKWLTLGLPAALVLVLLVVLINVRGNLEGAMANLARLLPVSYAFAAGMVASVNPCGVLMLPSYVLYQFSGDDQRRTLLQRALKGLGIALVVTAGFTAVFAAAGGIIAAGGQWLVRIFPYAGLLIGIVMCGLGLYLLVTHRTLGIAAASRVGVTPRRTLGNLFTFGIAYAVGSLSCTLPIFLVVVGGALGSATPWAALGQFLGYAGGMGVVIVIVTLSTALLQQSVARKMQRLSRHVHRLGAMFLTGAGAYLIYYWLRQF